MEILPALTTPADVVDKYSYGYMSALELETPYDINTIQYLGINSSLNNFAITNVYEQQIIKIKEINLRENTLEDVFIHLTGRKLRQ